MSSSRSKPKRSLKKPATGKTGAKPGAGRPRAKKSDAPPVPLVAVGASAGGLEAFKEMLTAMPADTGICLVFVQHLDPSHKSMLAELLARCTEMEVLPATDGLVPEPNKVVLIPPDVTLTLEDGLLRTASPAPPRQHRTPIDSFFESVAADRGEDAVCVILSGTGSDGSQGLAFVKEAGGLTIVQTPATTKYDSMPRNAIATGLVDQELAPAEIPAALVDHFERARRIKSSGGIESTHQKLAADLAKVCGILRARTGHEFRDYKEATMLRRINRRMQVLRIDDPADYIAVLQNEPTEVGRLLRELLISVTAFFRDEAAFEVLGRAVIADMVAKMEGGTLRLWVPGCATGEEAYTLAMLVDEQAEVARKRPKLQLFATDIDERALETARRGCYSAAAVAKVPERLRSRYFRPEGSEYRVVDELREMCIFSTQNIITDPPFGRLDLICCRNLLIYLKPELQERLIPIFHYALRPRGVLMLGSSENVTRHNKLFATVDSKWRIFRRRETETPRSAYPLAPGRPDPERKEPGGETVEPQPKGVVARAERLLLDSVGPAYAVINGDREVIYTGGGIDRFLTVPRGALTRDLLSMARPDVRLDIRALVHRAVSEDGGRASATVVLEEGERHVRIRIDCAPLGGATEESAMVISFTDCGELEARPAAGGKGSDPNLAALERELAATREYLQTTTEELESSNEELKSANEELMSMNEELQSANEELETSKEELQSVNEELETVNAELSAKVEEIAQSNSDLQNLLESTAIATLFLDRSLRVRRFTPAAKELFHLIDTDVGRTITDITSRIDHPGMEDLVNEVLTSQRAIEQRVALKGQPKAFIMRLLPYRSHAGVMDGVVLTFVDISALSAAEEAARRRADQQDFLAGVSGEMLKTGDPARVMEPLPARIAQLLNADFAKVLRKKPDSEAFELVATHGFPHPVGTEVAGGTESQAGYTLLSNGPVIVEDLRKETRFSGPSLLIDNHVRSGISTTIDGPHGTWGVLGVHSTSVRSFSADDIKFIQALANAISAGLQREAFVGALRESEERLVSALRAGRLGVYDYNPRSGRLDWDDTVRELWGIAKDAHVDYEVFLSGVHPEDREAVEADLNLSFDPAGTGHFESEYRVINALDGAARWVRAEGEVRFEQEEPARLVGTVTDITAQKRIDRHVKLLMREVNHRSKNLLSVVQAIARQTAKGPEPERFIQHLSERLQGLAASQDLIIHGEWQAVSVEELVRSQLAHLGGTIARQVELSGRETMLTATAAQAIGLALHELSTNALKYGSLSSDEGKARIRWSVVDDEFVMSWDEEGGPKVEAPLRSGFGSTVIKQMTASAVGGRVRLDFPEGGLSWELSAPRQNVIADPVAQPRGESGG